MRVISIGIQRIKQIFCGMRGHKYNGKKLWWSRSFSLFDVRFRIPCERCGHILYLDVPEENLCEDGGTK